MIDEDVSAMYAVYSAADEYRLCGFVHADCVDRLPSFLDPDAGCTASREPLRHDTHADTLRALRIMEGIPSCRP
jgi:hypothetical protein